KKEIYVVGAIACAALVTAFYGVVRGRPVDVKSPAPSAFVDTEARESVQKLRRSLEQRDAALAELTERLQRAQASAGGPPGPGGMPGGMGVGPSIPPAGAASMAAAPPATPPQYERFDIP